MKKRTNKPIQISARCGLFLLLAFAGCRQPQEYKTEADETVYQIIDQKWQDDFGSKANYKISDTAPLPQDLQKELTLPDSGVLTLRQAVATATTHNRLYQLEKELLYISALNLRLARHSYEPFYVGGSNVDYVKQGVDEEVNAGSFLGFNQLLASGALISTSVTASWVEILLGDRESGFRSFLNAAITQPLLRGGESRVVLENLTQAERDTVYQIRSFNRFRQTFVVSIISQYYLVLQQMDILRNAEDNYKALVILSEKIENLVAAGRLPEYELDQVRQEILIARDDVIDVAQDYHQALDDFKLVLGISPSIQCTLDENELFALNRAGFAQKECYRILHAEPSGEDLSAEVLDMLEADLDTPDGNRLDAPDHAVGISEADAIETAFALRLDLANKEDAIPDAQRKIEVAADSLRAELNLTADTSLSSEGSSDHLAIVGAQLNLPLDRMAEANVYRTALITLTQRQREYEEATDTIVLEIRRAHRNLTEANERYNVQLESLKLAKKRYENTLRLMRYGRASSRRVLDSQQALFEAHNEATQALVNHAIAMLEFYRDTGVLQVLPDGMWQR